MPMCSVFFVDGWMEDRAKDFHFSANIEESRSRDRLTDRNTGKKK